MIMRLLEPYIIQLFENHVKTFLPIRTGSSAKRDGA